MKASEVVFQQLLNGIIQYRVPLFQRTYNWEEKQWERLWEDILDIYAMDKPRNHFIGSVVTQPIPDAPERAAKYMLIDGQQRLTTLFLLLATIRGQAKTVPGKCQNLDDEIQEMCLTNKWAEREEERMKLRPTQQDRGAFKAAVNGESISKNTQIGKAQAWFLDALQEGDFDGNDIDLRKLKSCITDHLDLVSIKLDQEDSPNRIFESLNNTGMPLSVSDLIRNYLFMNIPAETQQEDAYGKYWYPMQESLKSEDYDALSDFFWRYLMMNGSLPRWDETFEGIRALVGNATPVETVEALRKFSRFSGHYARLAGLKPAEREGPFVAQVGRLNKWEVDVAYPFLMSAMDSLAQSQITEGQLVDVMVMIESFVVRRTVCGVPTNRLRRVFSQMASRVRIEDFVNSSRTFLLDNEWPGDKEFQDAFVRFRLYVLARLDRTRLVLTTLERSFGHKETPEMTDKITIEHVMPQTLTSQWMDMLGSNAREVHSQWLDTVGNLTLSGYNPDLGNKPFLDKKQLLTESNFALSKELHDRDIWNEQAIQDRARRLSERAVEIWKR